MLETQLWHKHKARLRQLRHEYRLGLLTWREYRMAVNIARDVWRELLTELDN
jgi:hypothetical protein